MNYYTNNAVTDTVGEMQQGNNAISSVNTFEGKSGKIEITGRFVKYVTNATVDMNLNDTGVYGAKLAK